MSIDNARLLAFATGILLALYLPVLPPAGYVPVIGLVAGFMLFFRRLAAVGWFLLGVSWHVLAGHGMLAREIPQAWEHRSLLVEGVVRGLPQSRESSGGVDRVRFEFDVHRAMDDGRLLSLPRPLVLRLNWYRNKSRHQALEANQRWRLVVKLRRPRGLSNPGGFDYRLWLLARGIGATGVVDDSALNGLLGAGDQVLDPIRQWYQRKLAYQLRDSPVAPLLAALAIGDRQQLSADQRRILAATGTGHLMVISGLHVGLCAWLGYWFCYLPLACLPGWVCSGRAVLGARLGALLLAAAYAALSGFSLPTQRALVMLLVYLLVRQWGRNSGGLRTWLLALCAVLLIDPLAGASAGFWLSFAAVGLLLLPRLQGFAHDQLVGERRSGFANSAPIRTLSELLSLQCRLLLGLCPLLAIWGGQSSILAPLVNFIAIPVVGFLVVPPLLLALLWMPVASGVAVVLLDFSADILTVCWTALQDVARVGDGWSMPVLYPRKMAIALAFLAVALFLLPRGIAARSVWPLLFFPLLFPSQHGRREFELFVLDVGQGTAIVARTENHVLVYDAGPLWAGGFDAGQAVVLPFLRRQGIGKLDRLIVSHADTDHSGGAGALIDALRPEQWMAPGDIPGLGSPDEYCRRGQRWQWDGVRFSVLHPGSELPIDRNNQSCVLLIETASTRFLLAGDIERPVELALAARLGPALESDVLLVPHHGSRSSSSYDFSWFVDPSVAVVSAGYHNSFGHPAAEITERYQALGSAVVNTALSGALHFSGDARFRPNRWFYTRYWQNYPCDLSVMADKSWVVRLRYRMQGCQARF